MITLCRYKKVISKIFVHCNYVLLLVIIIRTEENHAFKFIPFNCDSVAILSISNECF